jgi:prepilin-type N-terminal cleavage/methylation domain-containing protein
MKIHLGRNAGRGFTLIELLIVVAIIAVLAGIAVVNFLEAQTRSKVARAQSDLRTVATAIELYRTDHNSYPTYHYVTNPYAVSNISFHPGGEVTGLLQSPQFNGMNPLTTPIAYISAAPLDIFTKHAVADAPETGEYWYVNWDYALVKVGGAYRQIFSELRNVQGYWRLHSSGPDQYGPDTEIGVGQIAYDATNGTISRGDVVRTQKQGQV